MKTCTFYLKCYQNMQSFRNCFNILWIKLLVFFFFYGGSYRKCDNCIHLLDTFKPAVKHCENVVRYFQWKSSPKVEKIEITAAIGDNFKNLQKKQMTFLYTIM